MISSSKEGGLGIAIDYFCNPRVQVGANVGGSFYNSSIPMSQINVSPIRAYIDIVLSFDQLIQRRAGPKNPEVLIALSMSWCLLLNVASVGFMLVALFSWQRIVASFALQLISEGSPLGIIPLLLFFVQFGIVKLVLRNAKTKRSLDVRKQEQFQKLAVRYSTTSLALFVLSLIVAQP